MRRFRNGKIVATVGPAVNTLESIEKLYLSGVDVFRLNFSHGTYAAHEKIFRMIRTIEKKYKTPLTVLADLQGPKLRIGTFENNRVFLEEGDTFIFDQDPTPGNTKRVYLPHPEIWEVLKPGVTILVDDGKLRFELLSSDDQELRAKVIVGGLISNNKGVNIPDAILPIPALTEKDKQDLSFALDLGVDWVALSFVQNVKDVEEVRDLVKGKAKIMSKIEKPLAVKDIAPITLVSDGVMVARGDLGVEMNPEEVPAAQRIIINTCHRLGRPVVVATQMLESMITMPTPTRAEVSDVAYAIYSGADATMLSAESASGKYPFEAVQIMHKIIEKTEKDPSCTRRLEEDTQIPQQSVLDAKCKAAKDSAYFGCASCIVLYTDSFETAARCSRLRPSCPIVLITNSEETARQVGMINGVQAVIKKKEFDLNKMIEQVSDVVQEREFAKVGDAIILVNDIDGHSIYTLRM